MFRRLAHLAVVSALAATMVVTFGGDVATPQTGPTGYTVGFNLEPNGRFDCGFYSIDLSTGEATRVTPGGEFVECADGLTFSADGTLYAYRNLDIDGAAIVTELITIDPTTGDQTVVGDLPNVFVNSGGMTFDAVGNLWLYGESPGTPDCTNFGVCLWRVDPATADATFIGEGELGEGVYGLAGNCAGEVVAVTRPFSLGPPQPVSDVELQLVDTSTAALTSIVDLPDVFFPEGLDYDDAEVLWALAQAPFLGFPTQRVHQIDPTTGDVTTTPLTIDNDPFRGLLAGLAISPISCPEPPPPPPPEPAPAALVLTPTFTG